MHPAELLAPGLVDHLITHGHQPWREVWLPIAGRNNRHYKIKTGVRRVGNLIYIHYPGGTQHCINFHDDHCTINRHTYSPLKRTKSKKRNYKNVGHRLPHVEHVGRYYYDHPNFLDDLLAALTADAKCQKT